VEVKFMFPISVSVGICKERRDGYSQPTHLNMDEANANYRAPRERTESGEPPLGWLKIFGLKP
jgi:hypothetical protein